MWAASTQTKHRWMIGRSYGLNWSRLEVQRGKLPYRKWFFFLASDAGNGRFTPRHLGTAKAFLS